MVFLNFSKVSRWIAWAAVACSALLVGCDKAIIDPVPEYENLHLGGFDYTHRVIYFVTVEDEYGNSYNLGQPGGDASLSCCQTFKGENVKVSWEYSRLRDEEYENNSLREKRSATSKLKFAEPDKTGKQSFKYMYVHIFPDEHVEVELTNEMLGHDKFDTVTMYQTLFKEEEKIRIWEEKVLDPGKMWRLVNKIAGYAYIKYKITNTADLTEYVRLYMLVSPTFDEHPLVLNVLTSAGSQPGKFSMFAKGLTKAERAEIKKANPAKEPLPIEEER